LLEYHLGLIGNSYMDYWNYFTGEIVHLAWHDHFWYDIPSSGRDIEHGFIDDEDLPVLFGGLMIDPLST